MPIAYRKTLDRLIEYIKALSVGNVVASFVGFILQENRASWPLLALGLILFAVFLGLSIFYDRRYVDE